MWELGGNVTWLPPPPSDPLVTHFAVYLGNQTRGASGLGNASWGTNGIAAPLNTRAASLLFVYTCNDGGCQAAPAEASVVDMALLPGPVSFTDLDLDRGELGGTVVWPDPLPTQPDLTAAVCRAGTPLRVEGGSGNAPAGVPPAFFLGDLRLDVSFEADGIGVVALNGDLQLAGPPGIFQMVPLTAQRASFEKFLENATTSSSAVILLATWGNASALLTARARATLGSFGATKLAQFRQWDSYALIGIRAETPTGRESVAQVAAGVRALAVLSCPALRWEASLANGPDRINLGSVPLGTNSIALPPDLHILGPVNVTLEAVSVLAKHAAPAYPLRDNSASVSAVAFRETDPTKVNELGGRVTWTPPKIEELVSSYRVYLASSPSGKDSSQVGTDVPVGTNWLDVPAGTPRGNFTHLLIYIASPLAEQSTPQVVAFSEILGAAEVGITVAVIASVAAVQAVRVASTVFDRMNMESMEKCATKMDAEREYPVPVQGDFRSDAGDRVSVGACGLLAQLGWRGYLNPLFSCVHHHDPCIVIQCKGKKTKAKLQRLKNCENAWDSDEIVLRKITNRDIAVYGLDGETMYLSRVEPCTRKCMQTGACSRAAFRMYAPLLTLLGISVLVLASGDQSLGVILMVTVFACLGAMFIATNSSLVKEFVKMVAQAPPREIRDRFWTGVQLLVGCMPCAPAFMAQTMVGYITGGIAVTGAFCSALKAYGLGAVVEGTGGLAVAAISLWLKFEGHRGANESAASRYTASFMAAALITIKSFDGFMEGSDMLFRSETLARDALITDAEELADASGIGMASAVALQAFATGTMEPRMGRRLADGLGAAADLMLTRGVKVLELVLGELHGEGPRWPQSPDRLAFAVGRAIDVASLDLRLGELSAAKNAGHRQALEKQLEAKLDEIEDAVRQLLNGPLASKALSRHKACVKEVKNAHAELSKELKRLEETCVGASGAAGDRAHVEALGLCAAVICSTAGYVRGEVLAGGLSAVDLCILHAKVEQLQMQADRVGAVLGAIGPGDGDGDEEEEAELRNARPVAAQLREALRATMGLLQGLTAAVPSPWELQAIARSLDEVLEGAAVLAELHEAVCRSAPPSGEVDAQLQAAAEEDVRSRVMGSASQAFQPEAAARALCMARAAAGVVAAVADEIKASADRADRIVTAMGEARKQGYRALHFASQARENVGALSAHQLRRIQDEILKFTLGHPLQALVYLQEASLEASHNTFRALLGQLQSLADHGGGVGHIGEGGSPCSQSPPTSELSVRMPVRGSRLRVHPVAEAPEPPESPAHGMHIRSFPDLRETAGGAFLDSPSSSLAR